MCYFPPRHFPFSPLCRRRPHLPVTSSWTVGHRQTITASSRSSISKPPSVFSALAAWSPLPPKSNILPSFWTPACHSRPTSMTSHAQHISISAISKDFSPSLTHFSPSLTHAPHRNPQFISILICLFFAHVRRPWVKGPTSDVIRRK